jgi:two-component system OmpR family sensor kinase
VVAAIAVAGGLVYGASMMEATPHVDLAAVGDAAAVVAGACAAGLLLGCWIAGWAQLPGIVALVAYGTAVLPVALMVHTGPADVVAAGVACLILIAVLIAIWSRSGVSWTLLRAAVGTMAVAHLLGVAGVLRLEGVVHGVALVAGLAATVALLAGERRRRDRDRARIRAEAAQAHATRDHEIRNILAGLSGASHLLGGARTGLSPEERDDVREAFDAEVARLWALLDLHRDGTVRPRAVHESIDVVSTVREVAALWGVDGRLDVQMDEPEVWANCSTSVLKQALTNCLANCARHAPGARVLIIVRTIGMRARIEVIDDGPGLVSTMHYSCGSRTPEPQTTAGNGLGIGLQTTARLLGRYGGTVALRPAPSGGAQAVIEMPSVPVDSRYATFRA